MEAGKWFYTDAGFECTPVNDDMKENKFVFSSDNGFDIEHAVQSFVQVSWEASENMGRELLKFYITSTLSANDYITKRFSFFE